MPSRSTVSTAQVVNWRWWVGSVVIAWVIALVLWTPHFGLLPSGLNRDEAALGYNAYSLLKTGKDELGEAWPVSITSFGDQKLPGYVYTLLPFIAVFGLEPWVVRLPSLLAGLGVLAGMGVIASRVMKAVGATERQQLGFSLAVMIAVAISPWHLHFSRVAYEAHLAMALFTIGMGMFLVGIDEKRVAVQRWLLSGTALTWSLTLLTYHSYQLFLPFFVISLAVLYFPTLRKLPRSTIAICLLIGIMVCGVLIGGGVVQANAIKNRGISPFSTQKLLLRATVYRALGVFNPPVSKLFFNKLSEGVVTFSENYLTILSGSFFFVHGSGHGDHNPGSINNLHLMAAPGIILGLLALWQYRHIKVTQVVICWLLLAAVPSSLTVQPLHEVRLATLFPLLDLLTVIGFVYGWQQFPARWPKQIILVGFVGLVCISVLRTFYTYTRIAPQTAADNYPYHLLAQTLAKYGSQGKPVITQSVSSSPYIWYLFVNKIEPAHAQQLIERYPATDEGFLHVHRLGNLSFERINWDDIVIRSQVEPLILILKPGELPKDHQSSPATTFIDAVSYQDEAIYEIWQYHTLPEPTVIKGTTLGQ